MTPFDKPPAPDAVALQIANLRIQVSTLEAAAKTGSLPEMLRQTRKTMVWSAVLVAIALLGSSVIRWWSDRALDQRLEVLEHRVETMERGRTGL